VDDNPEYGDVWTFCSIDSETKLVPSFKCGKRNAATANALDLTGHETERRVYALAHETDDPEKPVRRVTVLHLHPVKSAQDAVKAAILQEARNLGTEES